MYRIIDEAEFVDPAGFKTHYQTTANRMVQRIERGVERGEIAAMSALKGEVAAWAMMGMNVFVGLRFGVWGDEDGETVAAAANRLLREGLSA